MNSFLAQRCSSPSMHVSSNTIVFVYDPYWKIPGKSFRNKPKLSSPRAAEDCWCRASLPRGRPHRRGIFRTSW